MLPDLCATRRFGRLLASNLMAGDVIALSGALGTGKSALARSIIQAVDPSEVDVPSPTFTIVQYYNLSDKTPLLHMDLYRIDSAKDAMSLGLDEAFVEAVCLIEWPDRLEKYLPDNSLSIYLSAEYNFDESKNSENSLGEESATRFADIMVPPYWSERINNHLLANIKISIR